METPASVSTASETPASETPAQTVTSAPAPTPKPATGKKHSPLTVVFGSVVVLFLIVMVIQLAQMNSPKWEYTVESIPDSQFTSRMDGLGAKGWEAVSARRASDGASYNPTFSYEIILKRRVK
jgi:hypothetical protein